MVNSIRGPEYVTSDKINNRTGELFNWRNFHHTCSGCDFPIEYGDEDWHLAGNCMPRKTRKQRKQRNGISQTRRTAVFERNAYRCVCCDDYKALQVDHIVAVANGGTDDMENLQTLCRSCNASKGTK